ncbi:MAG: hypothetical protein K9L26_04970 [Candidatus Izimaplasma sp.]|nr:hypothetical protein [Candidatus Izimaplasma bacterium]
MTTLKQFIVLFYVIIGITILGIIIGYIMVNLILLFISIGLFMISIIGFIITKSMTPFIMDRTLDIDALKAQGLTIVRCEHCLKQNVLEDQYCKFCHEPLGEPEDESDRT